MECFSYRGTLMQVEIESESSDSKATRLGTRLNYMLFRSLLLHDECVNMDVGMSVPLSMCVLAQAETAAN
jgi:hypothetical protein